VTGWQCERHCGHDGITVSRDDRDRLLIEVAMNIPGSQSQVDYTPDTDAFRHRLVREVREMKAEGIMPEVVED